MDVGKPPKHKAGEQMKIVSPSEDINKLNNILEGLSLREAIICDVYLGTHIRKTIEEAIYVANKTNRTVVLQFNKTLLIIEPKSTFDEVFKVWQANVSYAISEN